MNPKTKSLGLTIVLIFLSVLSTWAVSIKLQKMEQNPTGIQVGFWANYTLGGQVLSDFGRRPIDRVGFQRWNQIEVKKGEYNWGKRGQWAPILEEYEYPHLNGSTMIANINISFSQEVAKEGTTTIPSFYPQRITDPETRSAAKKFLKEYVARLLEQSGQVILAIDYEFPWFYDFRIEKNRHEYRDWIIEASQVARETAKELGKEADLKLICIVNLDPLQFSPQYFGTGNGKEHVHQQWLQDIFDASDYLGVDVYEFSSTDPSDPQVVFNSLKFWSDVYGKNKDVYLTEFGMSTVVEVNPSYRQNSGHHSHGSYEEQADFFRRFFEQVGNFNESKDGLNNRLRGVCIWMYADKDLQGLALDSNYGLVRKDKTRKLAWQAVYQGIRELESAPKTAPSRLVSEREIPWPLPNDGIELSFTNGTDFDRLVLEIAPEDDWNALKVTTALPGSVILNINDEHWFGGQNIDLSKQHVFELKEYLTKGESHRLTLYFTSVKIPFVQTVKNVELVSID